MCLARMGNKYETFVAIVAAAVMAEKATTEPMTAVVMTTDIPRTSQAACMGMCDFLLRRRKYLLPGKIPSREMA